MSRLKKNMLSVFEKCLYFIFIRHFTQKRKKKTFIETEFENIMSVVDEFTCKVTLTEVFLQFRGENLRSKQ
jgi:hypothetical protein